MSDQLALNKKSINKDIYTKKWTKTANLEVDHKFGVIGTYLAHASVSIQAKIIPQPAALLIQLNLPLSIHRLCLKHIPILPKCTSKERRSVNLLNERVLLLKLRRCREPN